MRVFLTFLFVGVALTGCNQTNSPPSANAPARAVAPADSTRSAQNTTAQNTAAPENTAVNRRDADGRTKTPIDQNENQADIDLTAKIRRQVLDVKDLSVDARNAKIITANGKVTLRGPVKSTEERDTIDRIARQAAGDGNVDNQLEVAANSTANNQR
jgi:osmotically-inducible protein OsmY